MVGSSWHHVSECGVTVWLTACMELPVGDTGQ